MTHDLTITRLGPTLLWNNAAKLPPRNYDEEIGKPSLPTVSLSVLGGEAYEFS